MPELNPWGNDLVGDYGHLFKEFGLQRVDDELLKKIGTDYRGFRRGLVFAHRDLNKFCEAKKTAVMTGIKPSSDFHLGSKMTAEEIIFFQKRFKSRVFYAIADLEAYADNGLSLDECTKNAIDNVADLLALGLDDKNTFFYRQSNNVHVSNLAHMFSKKTTLATLESLYGHQNLSLYFSALTQAADILAPQLEAFGGPKSVVVPVGVDQDPHIRLTRDLAAKFDKEYGFVIPSATYHKFFRALNGETKMSKRDPMNVLTMNDTLEIAAKKVSRALTGGRSTVEEQKKIGAEPHKCVVYELMQFHFYDDDSDLKEMYSDCVGGKKMCGECKLIRIKAIQEYLKKHQEKKKKLQGKAEEIVEEISLK